MTVVSVVEIPERRTGTGDFKTGRTYQAVYRVQTNDNNDGPKIVTAALPVTFTSTYVSGNESDSNAYCRNIAASLVGDDMRLWEVVVTYSTSLDWPAQIGTLGGTPTTPGNNSSNPLSRPAVFSFSTIKNKYNPGADLDGTPFRNTAGQCIKTLAYDRSLLEIQVSKNYAVSSATGSLLSYVDTINSATWNGYAAKSVKVDSIKLVSQYENGLSFYRGDWSFLVNPIDTGWHPIRVLSEGTYQIDANGKYRPCQDKWGRPIGSAPLDVNGKQVAEGGTAHFIEFKLYNAVSWTGIP